MSHSTPEQLRFPPIAGLSVRGAFDGGALSSDFGALVLRGVDRQIGLTERLAAAFTDRRHPGYIDHPLAALFAQRIYQIGCAYEDANDANALRTSACLPGRRRVLMDSGFVPGCRERKSTRSPSANKAGAMPLVTLALCAWRRCGCDDQEQRQAQQG